MIRIQPDPDPKHCLQLLVLLQYNKNKSKITAQSSVRGEIIESKLNKQTF